MLGRTHLVFGILSASLLATFVHVDDLPLFFVLTAIGALLPDIDHEGSTINKILPVTRFIAPLFTHRGFFHSVFPILALYFFFGWAGYPLVGLYLGFGYFSHLVSDSFTKLGVNFLHPLTRIRARGFIEVGTFQESIFFAVTFGAILYLAFF
jgi:inner membrane protein